MAALQNHPCSVISLEIVVDTNQRENRRTIWLGHKRDELIFLGHASLELDRDEAARQNDAAAIRFADRCVAGTPDKFVRERAVRPDQVLLTVKCCIRVRIVARVRVDICLYATGAMIPGAHKIRHRDRRFQGAGQRFLWCITRAVGKRIVFE